MSQQIEPTGSPPDDFVKTEDEVTGEKKPVLHQRGAFVFRLAGRERQQSASYYTPEVLTRFVVGQALVELIGPDSADPDSIEWSGREIPRKLSAREILDLTVCEPALGSGAFAIEAVRQLAEHYLTRRQQELGERIDPDAYPRELQKVKAYLALHQVYGVDLNATAVELAEISLWLDTMVEGLQAPWFGLHLRRGNSLIGARHAVFTRTQVEKKAWLTEMPRDIPLTDMPGNVADGREGSASGNIHHFLLPAAGWGSAIGAKEAKELAPEALERLKQWRKAVLVKPTKKQVDTLVGLGRRVEALWQLTWRRLTIAEKEIRRSIDIWGADDLAAGGAVTREQIEKTLSDPNGAYRRLRRVMDAWAAMWFWPLTEDTPPPSLTEWIETLQKLLGTVGTTARTSPAQLTLGAASSWDELDDAEHNDLAFALAVDVRKVIAEHPWLAAAQRVVDQQGFFHWELDFAPVFAVGGFDLQVGNPPWVRPRSDVEALLAEADPWWQLKAKSTAKEDAEHRKFALSIDDTRDLVLDGTADVASSAAFVGSAQQYPHLTGLQPDLYRCFMAQTWRHASSTGSVGLIHLESHFTDEKAGPLRAETYRRLRRHWQFINELLLFREIEDHKRYGINIYGRPHAPRFHQAASLYHPDTVIRSFSHDGSGDEPGIKDPHGNWDVRPHRGRIVNVDTAVLATWHEMLEDPTTPILQTRMVYAVNRATSEVLQKLSAAPRMATLGLQFSPGWHEKNDRTKGFFDSAWGRPAAWDDVILQGPNLHIGLPFFKYPNSTMKNNQDWSPVDLEALGPDEIPITSYKPRGDRAKYDASYTHWQTTPPQESGVAEPSGSANRSSARCFYRVAWRRMAANTGERTLISALVPPGAAHVHPVHTFASPSRPSGDLVLASAFTASLLSDFSVRSVPKSEILFSTIERMPFADDPRYRARIALRALRLNCATSRYAKLWESCYDDSFSRDGWTGGLARPSRVALGAVERAWSSQVPLRVAAERRQALLELDVLVAMSLGISADELCTIYRTQFPVLYGYDRGRDFFDAEGRVVPASVVTVWRRKGSAPLG
ncbi:MAG: restriction endonuclease [Propionicimonas sp.]